MVSTFLYDFPAKYTLTTNSYSKSNKKKLKVNNSIIYSWFEENPIKTMIILGSIGLFGSRIVSLLI